MQRRRIVIKSLLEKHKSVKEEENYATQRRNKIKRITLTNKKEYGALTVQIK